jgi:hypothetical protein
MPCSPRIRSLPPTAGPAGRCAGVARAGQLRLQVQVHRALHQLAELLALLGGERVHQPLLRGGPPGQVVDQLGQRLGLAREELAVLGHEVVELLLRVLAAGVRLEHRVEVGEHVLDGLHRLRARRLERLLHALELAVEDLAAQQVVDRLVGLRASSLRQSYGLSACTAGRCRPAACRAPARASGRRRTGRGTARAAPRQRLLEQLADLLQRPVELALAPGLPLPLGDLAAQVVQARAGRRRRGAAGRAAPAGAGAVEHLPRRSRPGRGDVVRRLERVPPAGPGAVAVGGAHRLPALALR